MKKKKMNYEIESFLNTYKEYVVGISYVMELNKFKVIALFPTTWIVPQNQEVELLDLGVVSELNKKIIEIYSNDDSKAFNNNVLKFLVSTIDVNKELEKKELDFQNRINKLKEDFDSEKITIMSSITNAVVKPIQSPALDIVESDNITPLTTINDDERDTE
jgi:hypothetical protein